jgi:hypothetical protein
MMGNIGYGRGTRLRAYGAEACAAPGRTLFYFSNIPLFLPFRRSRIREGGYSTLQAIPSFIAALSLTLIALASKP